MQGLSRSAAYVYADWGIRSNVIQPGWIETDMTAAMSNPAPYLINERSHHALSLMDKKEHLEEFLHQFR